MAKLIIGIGTGRCGTKSLAAFLNERESASVTHERFRAEVAWGYDGWQFARRLLAEGSTSPPLYGDVASYWLPHVERMIGEAIDSEIRIIALKRNKRETVRSFMRKTGGANARNHWQVHDGVRYAYCNRGGWDKCFPKFAAGSKRHAIEMYWSYYYGEVARLEEKYPDVVRCFATEALNTEEGQDSILAFIGIPAKDRHTQFVVHKNAGPPARTTRIMNAAGNCVRVVARKMRQHGPPDD